MLTHRDTHSQGSVIPFAPKRPTSPCSKKSFFPSLIVTMILQARIIDGCEPAGERRFVARKLAGRDVEVIRQGDKREQKDCDYAFIQ
jgi:hypothetical protein